MNTLRVNNTSFWNVLIVIGLITTQTVYANIDDSIEQVEDAAQEPLRTGDGDYTAQKLLPVSLGVKEDIVWGEFKDTDVTSFRTTASGDIKFPITENYFGAVSASASITNTNFSGNGQFIDTGKSSGDPWGDLYEVSLRFRSQYLIDDRWGMMFASWMVSRWEQGTNFDDGLKGAGAIAATYNIGDTFNIVLGVAASSKVVGSGQSVNPFGLFSWKIDQRHTFSTSILEAKLRSTWSDSITTDIYARYTGRRWRLEDRDDGVVNHGSMRDRSIPIGVGLQWEFLQGWRLRGDFGVVAYRQLKTTDEHGDTVDTRTSNAPGVFAGVLVQRRF